MCIYMCLLKLITLTNRRHYMAGILPIRRKTKQSINQNTAVVQLEDRSPRMRGIGILFRVGTDPSR